MFKLLFLKAYKPLSDADLMKRARTDLRYKFFLGLNPEDEVPDSSLLTYFRKLRLKDDSVLNRLIAETIKIAKDKGVLKSKTVIVDSTHTKSVYNPKTKIEILENLSTKLRKAVYKINEEYKQIMPEKPQSTDIQVHLDYCKQLSETIRNNVDLDLSLAI